MIRWIRIQEQGCFDSDPDRLLSKGRSGDQVILAQDKECPVSKISSFCIDLRLTMDNQARIYILGD